MLERDHELQTRLRTQAIIPILSSVLQDVKNVHLTIIQRNRHLKNAGEAGSAGGIGGVFPATLACPATIGDAALSHHTDRNEFPEFTNVSVLYVCDLSLP